MHIFKPLALIFLQYRRCEVVIEIYNSCESVVEEQMLMEKSRRLGVIIEIMNKKQNKTRRVGIIISLLSEFKNDI